MTDSPVAFELRGDSVASNRAGALRLDGGGDRFAWHFDGLAPRQRRLRDPGVRAEREVARARRRVPGIVANSAVEIDAAAVGGSWLRTRTVSSGQSHVRHALRLVSTESLPGTEEEAGADRPRAEARRVKGGWTGLGGALEEVNLRVAFERLRARRARGRRGRHALHERSEGRPHRARCTSLSGVGAARSALQVQRPRVRGDRRGSVRAARGDERPTACFFSSDLDLEAWELVVRRAHRDARAYAVRWIFPWSTTTASEPIVCGESGRSPKTAMRSS